MTEEESAYHELCAYTLTHGDRAFIHQYVVDTYMAQHADESTRPIGPTFALVGLYLHFEKGFTGREVQLAHMKLAREKRAWPKLGFPADRGNLTAIDVMRAPAGLQRDAAIERWAASVWKAFAESLPTVEWLLREHGII